MAEQNKKTSYKKPARTVDMVVEGVVKFSELQDGHPMFGYGLTLVYEDGNPTLAKIEEEHEKAVEAELALLSPAMKRQFTAQTPPVKVDIAKDGTETGMLKIDLRKKSHDKEGNLKTEPPELMDADNNIIKRKFIGAGSVVKAQITLSSYVMGKSVGSSLKLHRIKILEEKGFTSKGDSMPENLLIDDEDSVL